MQSSVDEKVQLMNSILIKCTVQVLITLKTNLKDYSQMAFGKITLNYVAVIDDLNFL